MNTIEHNIIIDGEQVSIAIRKHKTARRMIIRYQPLKRNISLTLPRYVSIRQGLHFVEEKQNWIAQEIQRHAEQKTYTVGTRIPLLGHQYTLQHAGGRGLVKLSVDPLPAACAADHTGLFEIYPSATDTEEKEILVSGDIEFMARRVQDWLKKLAREIIQALAEEKAKQFGVSIAKITLRDTSSHWGSCNEKGRLSFSWRLVMAPYEVLDYVVCHEVAHLLELNHSDAFWRHVERICPHWRQHKRWLTAHGTTLYDFT